MADGIESVAESTGDTIAGRTRTKFSLVDVPIDTLEASLSDTALDPAYVPPVPEGAETAEDREYQRFLSSLLPNEQENLSFLDEEDEEYRPEEEEEEHDEEEARRGISKKELTDLLLDSTHMSLASLLPVAAHERKHNEMRTGSKCTDTSVLPRTVSGSRELGATVPNPRTTSNSTMHLNGVPAVFQTRGVVISEPQCIQLASQMHKHLQLLLQSYHLLAKKAATSEMVECRAMIDELQERGEKALQYKNQLLSKLNPGTKASNGGEIPTERSRDSSDAKASSARDELQLEETSQPTDATENLVALRRVTRSLTAAHAAVAHPSMFELVGSQTLDHLLTADFVRACSVQERDRAIQNHLLQLDTHLVRARTRRKSKKGYSTTEDALLAHGVKRFGTQADAWNQIQRHLLPMKSTSNLRHRYKYLSSPKTGMNVVKAVHLRRGMQPHKTNRWLLEEDLRIARGIVELQKEKYLFSRLSKSYLPHRTRLEIRKRWERLTAKFRAELVEVGLEAPPDDSLDQAVAMKAYLEDKLRTRMLRHQREAEKAKWEAAFQLHQLGRGDKKASSMPFSSSNSGSTVAMASFEPNLSSKGMDTTSCRSKNLHPALFYSSWSFISPATLLNATCKHNWPSFMEEINETDGNVPKNPSTDVTSLDLHEQNPALLTKDVECHELFMPIAMPSDLGSTVTSDKRLWHADGGQRESGEEEEEEEEEEEDDSDYEHDELLSSDNDESESDFEQLEFTDDDDENDKDAGTDAFPFMSNSEGASLLSSVQEPPKNQTSLQHPLRLQNLGQPDNERMKRALAALERRIVGQSITKSDSVSSSWGLNSQSGRSRRVKRKIVATLVPRNGRLDAEWPATEWEAKNAAENDNEGDGEDVDVVDLGSRSEETAANETSVAI